VVGAKPITVHHASALYAFIFDDQPDDNSGAILLHVEDRTTHRVSSLLVDGRAHALLPSNHAFLLHELSPVNEYEVKVLEGHPPARTRDGKGGEAPRIAFFQNASWQRGLGRDTADATLEVLEAGHTYTVTGASWMRFLFLDGSADDNSGQVELQIVPKAGGNGFLRKLGGG
jgi:hypothetical protein